MLASFIPASMLNQKQPDPGIPNDSIRPENALAGGDGVIFALSPQSMLPKGGDRRVISSHRHNGGGQSTSGWRIERV
jgi:hypothetical protein